MTYDEFREAHMARHENAATSVLSIVGEGMWLAAVPAGVLTRSLRVAFGVFTAGTVVAVAAHSFQPGTTADEIKSVLRHPIWATRAETERVLETFA